MSKAYSLYNILDEYGFKSEEQKSALTSLLRQASILSPEQSIQDKFHSKNNYNDLVSDIIEFVKLTQKHFTIRSGHQERWEVIPHEWMTNNIAENLQLLDILGMRSIVKPKDQVTDAICVLGATMRTMEIRINYAALLVEEGLQANHLILLSGERYAKIGVDGSLEELNEIALRFQLDNVNQLTEVHLIQDLYKKSALYDKIPTDVIDDPARNLPRPTTYSTILALLEWLKDHADIKNIMFISNQPYIKYQEAVIREALRNFEVSIDIEVVGAGYSNNVAQSLIEGLGSFIFAATPNILIQSDEKITNPELIDSFKELYAKQPLIYQDLENHFLPNIKLQGTTGFITDEL